MSAETLLSWVFCPQMVRAGSAAQYARTQNGADALTSPDFRFHAPSAAGQLITVLACSAIQRVFVLMPRIRTLLERALLIKPLALIRRAPPLPCDRRNATRSRFGPSVAASIHAGSSATPFISGWSFGCPSFFVAPFRALGPMSTPPLSALVWCLCVVHSARSA